MAFNVGKAQAVIRRPKNNPPTPDLRDRLWFQMTNPLNPNEGILKYYDTNVGDWVSLFQADRWVVDEIAVAEDNQTEFTLVGEVANGERQASMLFIRNLGEQYYGTDYTITDNILTFIDDNYSLKTGDVLRVLCKLK